MDFSGKVILITGGGSGIGAATAKAFAAKGARVVVTGRTREKLDRTADDIRADGGEVLVHAADISVADEVEGLVAAVDEAWGRLDVLFAHAGVNGTWAPVDELTPDEWAKTIGINLTGTFHSVHYAVPLLKRQGGSIVITSSVNGTRKFTMGGASAYASSKAGVYAFGKMLALELAKHRIRVNVICPGAIDTEVEEHTERRHTDEAEEPIEYPEGSIPLTDGTPGRAEDVADLVLFLASDAARHVTGTPVWIDGGESLME